MGNKTINKKKISRRALRKLRKAIGATVPRSKGVFTAKCTVEQHSEATPSSSGITTGVCDNNSRITLNPVDLQIAATNEMAEMDTEKLIEAVKRRPALYNRDDSMYYNHKKRRSQIWMEIGKEIFSNWDKLRPQDKVEYAHELQKRWKSLRTCFTRELKAQKREKHQSETDGQPIKRRKRYEYFDMLTFLLNPEALEEFETARNSDDEVEEDDDSTDPFVNIKTETFNNQDNTVSNNTRLVAEAVDSSVFQPFYEHHENVEEKILGMLKDMKKDEADEDRQFMLSLVPSFRKLNDKQKFEARIEILRVLRDISFKDTN